MQEFKSGPKLERPPSLWAAVLPFKGQSLASLKSPSADWHLGSDLGGVSLFGPNLSRAEVCPFHVPVRIPEHVRRWHFPNKQFLCRTFLFLK